MIYELEEFDAIKFTRKEKIVEVFGFHGGYAKEKKLIFGTLQTYNIMIKCSK